MFVHANNLQNVCCYKSTRTTVSRKKNCVNLDLSTVKNSSGLNYIRKKVISKSKIHYINIMLITMLKLTNPNKNLFSMNAVPYLSL